MGGLLGRAPLYIPSTGVPGQLPEPQRLSYYAGIGALGVLGVLEWPVALVLAGGTLWPRINTTLPYTSSGKRSKTPEPVPAVRTRPQRRLLVVNYRWRPGVPCLRPGCPTPWPRPRLG